MNAILRYIGIGCAVVLPLYLFKRIINCCCCSKNRNAARFRKDDNSHLLDLPKEKRIFDRTAVPQDLIGYHSYIDDLKEEIFASDSKHNEKETEENLRVLINLCHDKTEGLESGRAKTVSFGSIARNALETIISQSSTSISLTKSLFIGLTDYVKKLDGLSFKGEASLLHPWYLPKLIQTYGEFNKENTEDLDLLISCLLEQLQKEITSSENKIAVHLAIDMTYASLEVLGSYVSHIKKANAVIIDKIKTIVNLIDADLQDFGNMKLGEKKFYSMSYVLKDIKRKIDLI